MDKGLQFAEPRHDPCYGRWRVQDALVDGRCCEDGRRVGDSAALTVASSSASSFNKVRRRYLSVIVARSLRISAMFALWTNSPCMACTRTPRSEASRGPRCASSLGDRMGSEAIENPSSASGVLRARRQSRLSKESYAARLNVPDHDNGCRRIGCRSTGRPGLGRARSPMSRRRWSPT
jgi:hypothetical protein